MDLTEVIYDKWENGYNVKIIMPEDDDMINNEFFETLEDLTNFLISIRILKYATSLGLDDLGDYLPSIIYDIPDIPTPMKNQLKYVSDKRYDKDEEKFIYEIRNKKVVRLLNSNLTKKEEDSIYDISSKILEYVNDNVDNL